MRRKGKRRSMELSVSERIKKQYNQWLVAFAMPESTKRCADCAAIYPVDDAVCPSCPTGPPSRKVVRKIEQEAQVAPPIGPAIRHGEQERAIFFAVLSVLDATTFGLGAFVIICTLGRLAPFWPEVSRYESAALVAVVVSTVAMFLMFKAKSWHGMAAHLKVLALAAGLPGIVIFAYVFGVCILTIAALAFACLVGWLMLHQSQVTTKSCTSCEFEIPKSASICGYCGREQPGMWPF